jgi:hypothetical protein
MKNLHCIETEDNFGADHAYIIVNGQKVWGPTKINDDQWRDINIDIPFSTTASVELWEQDDVDPDDYLGTCVARVQELKKGEKRGYFSADDARYELFYEVVEREGIEPGSRTLRIKNLHCFETEDYFGADHAYIIVNGVKVWGPVKINNNQRRDVNVDVRFSTTATVKLFEKDTGGDDYLGTWVARDQELNEGELRAYFDADDAYYELLYEVV